jgi:cytochrome c oxidase assembly factor CtaG
MRSWAQMGVSAALLAAYAVPYLHRARTLRRRGRPVPAWRVACFWLALAALLVAVSPPVVRAADRRLSVHMVEHLLIGDIAPLLLALAVTGPLLAPLLRLPAAGRLRALGHPVIALALWAVSLYAWHLRIAYEAAVRHELVHVLQHACFFVFGANLWLALLGPLPKPAWFGTGARLGYVIAISLIGTALAYTFTWADTAFYPVYGLDGQGAAGGVMLVEQSVVVVALLGWLLWRAIEDAGRRQELEERAAAAGLAIDRRRIARAVAADGGRALAGRIDGPAASEE